MTRYYYYKDIESPQTGEVIRIQAADQHSLALKVQRQYERWERERLRNEREEKKQLAEDKTVQNARDIVALGNILSATLVVDDKIDWRSLLDRQVYPGVLPTKGQFHQDSLSKTFSFIPAFKHRADEQTRLEDEAYHKALAAYKSHRKQWESDQKEYNLSIARKKVSYEKGEVSGVEAYISMVFDRSSYPDVINVNCEALYDDKSRTLLVDVDLPSKASIPKVQSFRYVATRDVIEEKKMTDKVFVELYNNTNYQIILRTIHEVFESDYRGVIKSVILNGNANVKNGATGKSEKKTIATIQVLREEFEKINLGGVNPAECFRHFKGVTAGSLADLSPVKPILKVNRSDRRIVAANDVLEEFDPSQNLASMKWEEFEVLIRDLIRKEFSGDGATVEVTRASRDAGVDAIAFDEDPIRGGKFVIQAKRYNNLVPLSAVRDLYGTVMNEGAVKGILVTTSYYGPDATKFAKDKPLTLINGEQLLYMFQKHGYDFKIKLRKKHSQAR